MHHLYAVLSLLAGAVARLRRPRWLVHLLIRTFARFYRIDTADIGHPLPSFSSLLSFFLRAPAPSTRPIDPSPATITSPVDASVSALGRAYNDTLVLVKGHHCTLHDLLQRDVPRYHGGAFIMLYLSPRDIHRIYAPCDAHVARCWSIPGSLFSVNPRAVQRRPRTFVRNRRIITELAAPWGHMLMVKIGACNVGRIVTHHPCDPQPSPPRSYQKGEELGCFELGSTVILLFEKDRATLHPDLREGMHILIGQPIATSRPPKNIGPIRPIAPTFQSARSTSKNAFCGMLTFPTCFMRFLPSFCFSSSLRLRVMSPP